MRRARRRSIKRRGRVAIYLGGLGVGGCWICVFRWGIGRGGGRDVGREGEGG